jgi:hypothetical protein
VAVILAVACASIVVEWLRGGVRPNWDWSAYADALPGRAIVVGLLAVADLWLGYRWFREPRRLGRRFAHEAWAEGGESVAFVPWPWTVFGRLLWHHLRQSALLLGTFIALVAPVAIAEMLVPYDAAAVNRFMNGQHGFEPIFIFFGGAVYLAPPLMGACVFLADQSRSRFRFLAERGIEPRPVWLSRQLVWFVPLVVGAIALLSPVAPGTVQFGIFFGYTVLGYACGQFFSMFCRSGILAAGLGIALTIALSMWAGLMVQIEMNWWWSVAPVGVALLVSTWLRAGDWLIERTGVRPVLRACSPLIGVCAAILVAVPTVRVYEIPYVDPGFSPAEFARPRTAEEEATLAIYRRAIEAAGGLHLPADRAGDEALASKKPALVLALEASRRPACDFFVLAPSGVSPKAVQEVHDLAMLLIRSASRLEARGQLDAAFERYLGSLRIAGQLRHRTTRVQLGDEIEMGVYSNLPGWAARPRQTSTRVLAAIRQLDETIARLPSRADAIKTDYVFFQRILDGDFVAMALLGDIQDSQNAQLLFRVLFWERYRTLRELNQWTAEQLPAYEHAEREATAGGVVRFIYSHAKGPQGPVPGKGTPARVDRTSDTPHFGWIYFGFSPGLLEGGLVRIETERRATRLVMALEAWKLDHGKLPNSLDEVQGKYLAQIPVDLVWGQPLRYFPQGLPFPPRPEAQTPPEPKVRPGQPCIVAPFGWVTDQPGFPVLEMRGGRREFDLLPPPPTAEQLAESGWVFPIP